MPGGRGPAERSFQRALKLDPTLKEQIAALRKEAALNPPPPAKIPTTRPDGSDVTAVTQPAGTGTINSSEPKDPMKKVVGPQKVGAIEPSAWGKQPPEEMAAAVAKLKQFANDTQ